MQCPQDRGKPRQAITKPAVRADDAVRRRGDSHRETRSPRPVRGSEAVRPRQPQTTRTHQEGAARTCLHRPAPRAGDRLAHCRPSAIPAMKARTSFSPVAGSSSHETRHPSGPFFVESTHLLISPLGQQYRPSTADIRTHGTGLRFAVESSFRGKLRRPRVGCERRPTTPRTPVH